MKLLVRWLNFVVRGMRLKMIVWVWFKLFVLLLSVENEYNDRKNLSENGGDLKLLFVFVFVFILWYEDYDKIVKFIVISCLFKVEYLYWVVIEVIFKVFLLKYSLKIVLKMGSVKLWCYISMGCLFFF